MTQKYQELAFTDAVRAQQEHNGSASAYSHDKSENPENDVLGQAETAFIESRDSFYMATVSSSGWPYVQHRGGPAGFLKVVSPTKMMMPDFRGNRQYVSLGNLAENNRASLFFMDYPRRGRLKIFARVRAVDLSEDDEITKMLAHDSYKGRIERALEFTIEAFDWNCPQHITPRYTETDIRTITDKLTNRIAELEEELKTAKT